MRITNWEMKEQVDTVEVSADVDGYRLWYRVPRSFSVSRSGDPFLAAALLPAMRQGEKLEIDAHLPVSPRLLRRISRLQEIFHCWNPQGLKEIPVSATTATAEQLNAGSVSFFSGGVDSTYTFLKHQQEIDHVIFIQGFDFYANSRSNAATFTVGDIADLSQLAHKLSLPRNGVSAFLAGVLSKTTLRTFSTYWPSGSDPSAFELALAGDFDKVIAGSLIYEEQRFRDISLRDETRRLLDQHRQAEDLRKLNRLLLEDAYPTEVSRLDSVIYPTAIDRNARFVQGFGKTFLPVETNHYPFGYRYNLSRNLSHGSCLGSVALLLGFPTVYVPASYSYNQLFPLGSHPLPDPLWSNECVEVIHDGCEAGRTDKLKRIVTSESALTNLRVCFDNMNVNCARCPKCLRTMISLKLLNAPSGPFPPLPSPKVIRESPISGAIEMAFLKENISLALQHDTANHELRDALCVSLQRHERNRLFKKIDEVLLGGFINRVRRLRRGTGIRRIDTTPTAI